MEIAGGRLKINKRNIPHSPNLSYRTSKYRM